MNDLLGVFDISFGDALLEGQMTIADEKIYYASGVNIVRFPVGGTLLAYQLADKATAGEEPPLPFLSFPSQGRLASSGVTKGALGSPNCLQGNELPIFRRKDQNVRVQGQFTALNVKN